MKATRFSIGDCLYAAATGRTNESFEAASLHTLTARAAGLDPQGVLIPWPALTRTGLTTTNIAAPEEPAGFVPVLRNLSVLGRAGATFRALPGHKASVVQQTGTATAVWVGENPGSDVSRSNLTVAPVSLAFKTIQATTMVSRQSIFSAMGGGFDLEQIIQNDIAACIAVAIDLAGANGSGSSNQPLGILQDTAVGTVAFGTNGAALDRTFASTLEKNVASANADQPGASLAFVTTPGVRFKSRTALDLGAGSGPLWHDDNTLIGLPALSSNQLPSTLTKGTSTTVCSALIFGAWEQLLVGLFGGGFDVVVDPYTLKNQNMLDITVRAFVDIANRRPTAFQVVKDALAT
jgi:HK97 family phage major capsid protein